MKKRINKKKIIILILLLILVIFEIVAFRDSGAKNILQINVTISDNDKLMDDKNITIDAINENEEGYYITLPDNIDGKIISKFFIEEKKLENNITTNGNNKENETDKTITENQNTKVEKIGGEKLYLTQEEINSKSINLSIQYDKKEKNGQTLYAKTIEQNIDDKVIKIQGYMPQDAEVKATQANEEEVTSASKKYLSEKVTLYSAYDVKIISNNQEYEPNEFDEDVKVSISGIDDSKYKVLHIDDTNKVEEIQDVQKTNNNEVTFTATEFSTYALLFDDTDTSNEANIITTPSLVTTELGTSTWGGNVATGYRFGNGTSTSPYLISSAEELAYMASQVNNGNEYEGTYFQLITDIDLNNQEWTPIGTVDYSFRGVFDGGGYSISNVKISTDTSIGYYETFSYGFFGSIGGGTTYTTIRNVEFDNVNVDIKFSGTAYYSGGVHVGCVTGTMYSSSEIKNVIVKNSTISDSSTIQLATADFQLFVGGIAGMASNASYSEDDPGEGYRYKIENCFSDTDIALDTTLQYNYRSRAGQYAVGGVIGAIRSQPVWPSNCLYTGTINANLGFTGPIFAYLRDSSSYSTSYFSTIWNGQDAGTLTMDSYYTAYSTNSRTYTSTYTTGTTPNSSTYRKSTSSSNIGNVQGMNKGIYTNNLSSRLDSFNTYAATSNNYVSWTFENNSYSLTPKMEATISDTNRPIYQVTVTNTNQNPTYSYTWYVDNVLNSSVTGDSITQNSDWNNEYKLEVLVGDGTNYALASYTVPKLEIHIEFTTDETNNTITGTLAGSGLAYVNLSDYTYQWYSSDYSGLDETTISGATSTILSNAVKVTDYKFIATNTANAAMTAQGTMTYGDRIAIFVDYQNGNNNNDGLTPQTAVKNMSYGYNKLNSTGEMDNNIIVLMNDYTTTDYLSSATATTFATKATITGVYRGTDYSGTMIANHNNGMFLTADTTFGHMKFRGSTNEYRNRCNYVICPRIQSNYG